MSNLAAGFPAYDPRAFHCDGDQKTVWLRRAALFGRRKQDNFTICAAWLAIAALRREQGNLHLSM
jgi:hypothetical protein